MLPLRVLVADDHHLFRQGLVSLMSMRPDLVAVVGEAANGKEAVLLAKKHRPDIILMDLMMPGMDGFEATRILRHELPESAIIILTSSEQSEHLFEAMRLGASGYLLKNLDAEEFFSLLAETAEGGAAITRVMAARLMKGVASQTLDTTEGLTERELEVLRMVALGASNPQISEELSISLSTVKTHLHNILNKLDLDNRTQAAAFALRNNLISNDDN
jgi:two-component system, NarL family, response regulator LiaR